MPECWLVIVPRGSAGDENVGTPFEAQLRGSASSPRRCAPAAVAEPDRHPARVQPVDSPCASATTSAGSPAPSWRCRRVSSWQPALCASRACRPTPTASSATPAPASSSSARVRCARDGRGRLDRLRRAASTLDNPVVYAPIGVVGRCRSASTSSGSAATRRRRQPLAGVRVADLNLTPRLVAKLLTQSYRSQVAIEGEPSIPGARLRVGRRRTRRHLRPTPTSSSSTRSSSCWSTGSTRNFGGLVMPGRDLRRRPAGVGVGARRPRGAGVARRRARRVGHGGEPRLRHDRRRQHHRRRRSATRSRTPSRRATRTATRRRPGRALVVAAAAVRHRLAALRPGFGEAARRTAVANDGARIGENVFAERRRTVWRVDGTQTLGTARCSRSPTPPSAAPVRAPDGPAQPGRRQRRRPHLRRSRRATARAQRWQSMGRATTAGVLHVDPTADAPAPTRSRRSPTRPSRRWRSTHAARTTTPPSSSTPPAPARSRAPASASCRLGSSPSRRRWPCRRPRAADQVRRSGRPPTRPRLASTPGPTPAGSTGSSPIPWRRRGG